jgi:hypothetical protein
MSRRSSAFAALPLALGLAASAAYGPAESTSSSLPPTVGTAVLTRDAVLRSGPSKSATRLGTVEEGDVVYLLPHGHRSGFLRVLTRDEATGWISDRNAHAISEAAVHEPAATPAALLPSNTAKPLPAPATVAAGDFNGCPPQGTPSPHGSRYQELLDLNRHKNRGTAPSDAELDRNVTLAAMLRRGDDAGRWSEDRGAELVAYVYHVKPGADETVNCHLPGDANLDTHIELTLDPSDTDPTRRVIVEVTPRWRAAMLAAGEDWSTQALQHTIEGRWVRFRGWLLWDAEHNDDAENTNPGGNVWRATAWEIHPVTSMTVVPRP